MKNTVKYGVSVNGRPLHKPNAFQEPPKRTPDFLATLHPVKQKDQFKLMIWPFLDASLGRERLLRAALYGARPPYMEDPLQGRPPTGPVKLQAPIRNMRLGSHWVVIPVINAPF